jgi:hypothetical protein
VKFFHVRDIKKISCFCGLQDKKKVTFRKFKFETADVIIKGICKLRNGVNKTPQFLLFSMAKGGTKTIAHLYIAEGSSF